MYRQEINSPYKLAVSLQLSDTDDNIYWTEYKPNGEEMHGVWSWGSKANMKTKEDLERGCPRGLSSS